MAEKKEKRYVSDNAQLMVEWDWAKNTDVDPTQLSTGSHKKVWWIGKCGHTWLAAVQNRISGSGCLICSGKIVLAGFNDLESQFPKVAREWAYDLNEDLAPSQVSAHSDRKVWWCCSDCEEKYRTSIYSRTSLGTGCPVCHNRVVVQGKNDLATTHPQIAKEWNYGRNRNLSPTDFVAGSNKRVWWICKNGHEWQATIVARKNGRGCPVCAKEMRPMNRQMALLKKNGSLADNHPNIAEQWHPTKNADLTPSQISSGSKTVVWWMCEKGHEWKAAIYSRVAGRGCPYCSNEHSSSYPEQILFYYLSQATTAINRHKLFGKEIDIYLPKLNIGIEYNGRYYHRNRATQDNDKYHFLREHGLQIVVIQEGNQTLVDGHTIHYQYLNSDYLNFDFVVRAIFELCKLPTCDINICRDRAKVFEQYMLIEKANSLAQKYPWLINEWDYERNGKLTPWQVSYGSKKRIHWICQKCGYHWEATAYSRKDSGCPCCANRIVVKGINDLGTTHPHLLQEWDYAKNETSPENVVAGSHQYAWWKCQYNHNWSAQIKSRTQGTGCPICTRRK